MIKLILVLVGMLFLNIEAAHAGLVGKVKLYIRAEFAPEQLTAIVAALLGLAVLGYVLFTPVRINNERRRWLNYFSHSNHRKSMRHRRQFVARINHVLVERRLD